MHCIHGGITAGFSLCIDMVRCSVSHISLYSRTTHDAHDDRKVCFGVTRAYIAASKRTLCVSSHHASSCFMTSYIHSIWSLPLLHQRDSRHSSHLYYDLLHHILVGVWLVALSVLLLVSPMQRRHQLGYTSHGLCWKDSFGKVR